MRGVDKLANATHRSEGQEAHTLTGAIVSGVNLDGTVDVRYLGQEHPGIDCLASYTNRLAGDNVMIRDSGGRWVIMGKIGAEVDGAPNISWGNGDPVGADWQVATDVRVSPGQIYIKGTGLTAGNSLPTPQKPIVPSSAKTFQGGSWNFAFASRPAQGVESSGLYGSGAWDGAWFYSSDISTAAAAKAVLKMELHLQRSAELLGLDEAVIAKIYVHNHTVDTSTTSLAMVDGPYSGPSLEVGQSAWWQVPQAIVDMFVANTIKGFAIRSSLAEEFMVMADDVGEVRIYN